MFVPVTNTISSAIGNTREYKIGGKFFSFSFLKLFSFSLAVVVVPFSMWNEKKCILFHTFLFFFISSFPPPHNISTHHYTIDCRWEEFFFSFLHFDSGTEKNIIIILFSDIERIGRVNVNISLEKEGKSMRFLKCQEKKCVWLYFSFFFLHIKLMTSQIE